MTSYRLVFPVVNKEKLTCFGVSLYNRTVCEESALWNSIDINNKEKKLDYLETGLSGAPSGDLFFTQLFNQQSTKVKSPHLQITFRQIDRDNFPFTIDINSDSKTCTRLNFTCESAGLALYLASKSEFPKENFYTKTLIVSCAVDFKGGGVSAISLINGEKEVYDHFKSKLKYISNYQNNYLKNNPIVILHKKDILEIGIEEIEKITSLRVCPFDKDPFASKECFEKYNNDYSIFGIDSNSLEQIFAALDLVDPFGDFPNLNSLDENFLPSAKRKMLPKNTYYHDLFQKRHPEIKKFELGTPDLMERILKEYPKSNECSNLDEFYQEALSLTLQKLFRINKTSPIADKYKKLDRQDKIQIETSYLMRKHEYSQIELRKFLSDLSKAYNEGNGNFIDTLLKSRKNLETGLSQKPDCFSIVSRSKNETKEKLKIITSLLDKSNYRNRYLVFQCSSQNWEAINDQKTITIYNDEEYEFYYKKRKYTLSEVLLELGKYFNTSVDYLIVVYPTKNVITSIYLGQDFTSNLKIGDSYFFGNYLQNRFNLVSTENTRIKWDVIDIQGNKLLLLSSKILFRSTVSPNLNNLLNTDFYNEAFSETEKKQIKKERFSNIFLLSRKDISNGYISRKENRIASESEYSFIKEEGIPSSEISLKSHWLLEKEPNSSEIFYVNNKGQICSKVSISEKIGIRPALWLEIENKNIFTDLEENSIEFIKKSINNKRSFLIKYKRIKPNAKDIWIKNLDSKSKKKFLKNKEIFCKLFQIDAPTSLQDDNDNVTEKDLFTDLFNVDLCSQFIHSLILNEKKDPDCNHIVFTLNGRKIQFDCNDFFEFNFLYPEFISLLDIPKHDFIWELDRKSKVASLVLTEEVAKLFYSDCQLDDVMKNAQKTKDCINKLLDDYKIPKEVEWLVIPSKKELFQPFGNCVYVISLKQINLR